MTIVALMLRLLIRLISTFSLPLRKSCRPNSKPAGCPVAPGASATTRHLGAIKLRTSVKDLTIINNMTIVFPRARLYTRCGTLP